MKKYITFAGGIATITSLVTLLPLRAFALQHAPNIKLTPDDVVTSLCNISDWLFYILIVLSVIMMLMAGFTYLTANGDPEKVGKAGKMIMYAAIGVVVGLVAKGFPNLVGSFFSASFTACP